MTQSIRYELQQLEDLIAQSLITSSFLDDEQLKQQLDSLEETIKQQFHHHTLLLTDQYTLHHYISYHQDALLRFIHQLERMLSQEHQKKNESARIVQLLLELLSFLHQHFREYLSMDVDVPQTWIKSEATQFQSSIEIIQQYFTQLQADASLILIVLSPLQRIINKNDRLTFDQLNYAHAVEKELLHWTTRPVPHSRADQTLSQLILYLNINSFKAFRWMTQHYELQLHQMETTSGRIEHLSAELKSINQAKVFSLISYHTHLPSLQSQLQHHLTEELDHLHRLRQFAVPASHNDEFISLSFRLMLELSVAQLAFLLRLLVESKIIRNTNLSELLRFFSKHTTTKKTEQVSYDSLRAKYYNAETGARLSIKELLTTLLSHIDRIK